MSVLNRSSGASRSSRACGFVEPFGKTQSPDFSAQTIINVSNIPGAMVIGWPFGSTSALNINQVD